MTLIRSAAIAEQSVVLTQKRSASEAPTHSAFADAMEISAPVITAAPELRFTYEEFLERYQEELAALRQQAVDDGFAQGKNEGREQGEAEFEAQLEKLAALLASARASLDAGIDGVTDIAVEIVYEAVVKIIGERMTQRDAVVATVREVIRHAKERNRLVARVAPYDLAWIEMERLRLIDGLNTGDVELVADERVQMGGCLLETPAGNLDGRLEIQLEQLRDALLNARQR
ncbi:MAG: hypothetical protein HY308_18595 [Gammaproteobacteria bacterium]|nr:hypothetical protein [Gammaproteobacteria bacterium]